MNARQVDGLGQDCASFIMQKELEKLFHRQPLFKSQGVNSLWPSETIWGHRTGSTLAQVMACWQMATSHYQNKY